MNDIILKYKKITCKLVNTQHIDCGWLDWMNNAETIQNLSVKGPFLKNDLCAYLKETDSLLFLACYSETGIYFGNLRIYQTSEKIASFGRLIGDENYRGKGYGTLMSELAISLIFDFFKFETIIVGNKSNNHASKVSKIKSGFRKLKKEEVSFFLHRHEKNTDYYIKQR